MMLHKIPGLVDIEVEVPKGSFVKRLPDGAVNDVGPIYAFSISTMALYLPSLPRVVIPEIHFAPQFRFFANQELSSNSSILSSL